MKKKIRKKDEKKERKKEKERKILIMANFKITN